MKPSDYIHIEMWGRHMGSYPYYILKQQQSAAEDNAPVDALYKRTDGTWATWSQLPATIKQDITSDER